MAGIAVLLNYHYFFFWESFSSTFQKTGTSQIRTCQLHERFINEPMLIGLAKDILYLSMVRVVVKLGNMLSIYL